MLAKQGKALHDSPEYKGHRTGRPPTDATLRRAEGRGGAAVYLVPTPLPMLSGALTARAPRSVCRSGRGLAEPHGQSRHRHRCLQKDTHHLGRPQTHKLSLLTRKHLCTHPCPTKHRGQDPREGGESSRCRETGQLNTECGRDSMAIKDNEGSWDNGAFGKWPRDQHPVPILASELS